MKGLLGGENVQYVDAEALQHVRRVERGDARRERRDATNNPMLLNDTVTDQLNGFTGSA